MSAAVTRKQCMPDQERRPEDLHIPLHVEEVSVSRREIKKADVQIALITGTREQLIDEELTRVRLKSNGFFDRPDRRNRAAHSSGGRHHDHPGRRGSHRRRAAVGPEGRSLGSAREYKRAASRDRDAAPTGSCGHAGGAGRSVAIAPSITEFDKVLKGRTP